MARGAKRLGLDYSVAVASAGIMVWLEGVGGFLTWESLQNSGKEVEEMVERMRRRLLSVLEVEIGRAEYRLQELKKMKEKLSALRVVE